MLGVVFILICVVFIADIEWRISESQMDGFGLKLLEAFDAVTVNKPIPHLRSPIENLRKPTARFLRDVSRCKIDIINSDVQLSRKFGCDNGSRKAFLV